MERRKKVSFDQPQRKTSRSSTASLGRKTTTTESLHGRSYAPPVQVKIVVVGLGGVGKSALTCQFLTHRYLQEYDPTLEDTYEKTEMVDGQLIEFQLTDTAGQSDATSQKNLVSADAFLIVYSITDRESFKTARLLNQQIREHFKTSDVPIVLVGNKTDIEDQRTVTRTEGRSLASHFCSSFHELSAAKGYSHITNVIYELAKEVLDSRAHTGKRKWLRNILRTFFLPKLCYSSNTAY